MDAVRIVPPRKLLRVQHVRKLALTIKLPEFSLPRPSMDVSENNPRTFRLGTTAGIVVVHEGADVYDPRAPIGLEQGEKKVGQVEMTNVVGHETGIIRLPSDMQDAVRVVGQEDATSVVDKSVQLRPAPVSYTHLTLPTILLV